MLQIIVNYNYHIKSLNYFWNTNILDICNKEFLEIDITDAKQYASEYIRPYVISDLWESLKYIKGIDNKEQIKLMIKSLDLSCIVEIIYFDVNRLNDRPIKNSYLTLKDFENDIPVYKNYFIDYKYNKWSLVYGDTYPNLQYCYASNDYRINIQRLHKLEIGSIVDFINPTREDILSGVILSCNEGLYKLPEMYTYDIALLNKKNDNYIVYWEDYSIPADDVIKVYGNMAGYTALKDVVLNDKVSGFWLGYNDEYKNKVKEFLKSKDVL